MAEASGSQALAFGRHMVAGTLGEVRTPGETFARWILGEGEWDGIELDAEGKPLVWIDGERIDPAAIEFSGGGATPAESLFMTNSLSMAGVARITLRVPDAKRDKLEKMRLVARCLKIPWYNSSGVEQGVAYSTNPADQFVYLIKRATDKLGLNIADHIDWTAYAAARTFYAQTLTTDLTDKLPRNFKALPVTGSLALPIGDWVISIQAKSSSDVSRQMSIQTLTTVADSQNVTWSFEPAVGITDYTLWATNDSGVTWVKSELTGLTPNEDGTPKTGTISAAFTAGGPPAAASGVFLTTIPRFQSNVFFNSKTELASALRLLLDHCCSDYTLDGKRYRILTPEARTPLLTFDETNTTEMTYWEKEYDERPNRIEITHRDVLTLYNEEVTQPALVERSDSQNRVGVVEESWQMGPMPRNQATRIANYRARRKHDLALRLDLTDDGSAPHLLPGDVVFVRDHRAAWVPSFDRMYDGFNAAGATIGTAGTGFASAVSFAPQADVLADLSTSAINGSSRLQGTTGALFDLTISKAGGLHPTALAADDRIVFYALPDPASPPPGFALYCRPVGSGTATAGERWEHDAAGLIADPLSSLVTGPVQYAGSPGAWMRYEITAVELGLTGAKIEELTLRLNGGGALWVSNLEIHLTGTGKKFEVIEIEDDELDQYSRRRYTLDEYSASVYSDSDTGPLSLASNRQAGDLSSTIPSAPGVSAFTVTSQTVRNDDGTINFILTGDITFTTLSVGTQQGLVFHRKPNEVTYNYLFALTPDPTTHHAGFRLDGQIESPLPREDAQKHWFKVVPVNSGNVQGPEVYTSIAAVVDRAAPPIPGSSGGTRWDNGVVRRVWTPASTADVKGYNLYHTATESLANGDTPFAFTQSNEYASAPTTATSTIYVRAVTNLGAESSTALAVSYTFPSLAAPTLEVITDNPTNVLLNVSPVTDTALLYQIKETEIQIATDAGFTANVHSEIRTGYREFITAIGAPGTLYYFRARFNTIFGGSTAWGATISHTYPKIGDYNAAIGNLQWEADDTYDIGLDELTGLYHRPRSLYLGSNMEIGGEGGGIADLAVGRTGSVTPGTSVSAILSLNSQGSAGSSGIYFWHAVAQKWSITHPGAYGASLLFNDDDHGRGHAEFVPGSTSASARSKFYSTVEAVGGIVDGGGQVVDVRAYGAKCDGVTNDTAAVNSAYAAAKTARQPLYFPKGTTLCNLVIDTYGVTVEGAGPQASFIKSYDAAKAVIEIDASVVSIHSVTLRNFGLVGSTTGSSNHGLYVHGSNLVAGLTVSNISISACGGRGIYDLVSFTARYEDVFVGMPAGSHNAIELAGGNTTTLHRCYVTTVATGKAAYRIYGGRPTLIACNGINSGTTADWGVFGQETSEDGTDTYCFPNLVECNIEDFTRYGVRCKVGSAASFRSTTFLAPPTGTVTAIRFEYVTPAIAGQWDSLSTIATKGAAWNNSQAVHSNGTPFVFMAGDSTPANSYWGGTTFSVPRLSVGYIPGSGNYNSRFTRAQIDALESSTLVGDLLGGLDYTGARVFVKAPIADKGGAVFDVRGYGAKLDGTTNDQAAFDAAFVAASAVGGGVVFVPAGVTRVTKLTIPANVVVRGAGKKSTIIKQVVTNAEIILITESHCGIEDLTVHGNMGADNESGADSYPLQHGIIVTDPTYISDVTIRRVSIEQTGGEGLKIDHAFSSLFSEVETTWTYGAAGISVDATAMPNVRFTDCYVHSVGRYNGVGYWIRGGNPILTNCNGIDGWGTGGTSAVVWMRVGQNSGDPGGEKFGNPILTGCNVESFTATGIQHRIASTSRLYGCSFTAHTSGANRRALQYETGGGYAQNGLISADCSLSQDGDGVTYLNDRAIHSYGRPGVYAEPGLTISNYRDTLAGADKPLPFTLGLTSTPNTRNLVLATGNKAETKAGLLWDEGSSNLQSPGRFWGADVSAGAPTFSFTADYSTGMYRDSSGGLSFAYAGSEKLRVRDYTWTANSIIPFTDNAVDLGINSTNRFRDLSLSRDARIGGILNVTGATTLSGDLTTGNILPSVANVSDIGSASYPYRDLNLNRNIESGTTLRLYNTSDRVTNYERGGVRWTSNELQVYTEAGGAGQVRDLRLMGAQYIYLQTGGSSKWLVHTNGHWLTQTDNNYDIGQQSANRPRALYIAGKTEIGTTIRQNSRFYPNVLHYTNSGTVNGAFLIQTPFSRTSDIMFSIRVRGYFYNKAENVDATFVGYCYNGANDSDGIAGQLINYSVTDNGNDGRAKSIGFDSTGKLNVIIGTHTDAVYYPHLTVDCSVYLQQATDWSSGWAMNTSSVSGLGMAVLRTPTLPLTIDWNGGTPTLTAKTHFLMGTDNTYSIGLKEASRPNEGHFGTLIHVGGSTKVSSAASTLFYDNSGGSPTSYSPQGLFRRDSSATTLANSQAALAVYNQNGGDNTWTKFAFVSQESTSGSAGPVAIAGIAGQKISGTAGAWATGDLVLWTKNNGTIVEGVRVKANGETQVAAKLTGQGEVVSAGKLTAQADVDLAGNNGVKLSVKRLEELVSIVADATESYSSIEIPAGALVLAVTGRVTVTDTGAGVTNYDIGVDGANTRYATGIGSSAGATFKGTQDGIRYYATAEQIRITPNATPSGGVRGKVRVVIEYIEVTPPTS